MSRIAALFRKDLRTILRSRLLMVVLILYPLVIVGIIGYAFSDPKQKIPVAVVNLDVDAQGRPNVAVIEDPFGSGETVATRIDSGQLMEELDLLTEVHRVPNEAAGRQLLLTGQVQAVVILGPGFVDQVARFGNGSARLEVIVDQSDAVRAAIVETGIRGVVQAFQEAVVQEKVTIVVAALDESLSTTLPEDHFVYPGFTRALADLRVVRNHEDLSADERDRINRTIDFLTNLRIGVQSSIEIVSSVAQPVLVDIVSEQSGRVFIRDLVVPAALGLSIFWTGSLATAALVVYERESPAYVRLGVTPVARLEIMGSKVVLTTLIILGQSILILLAAMLVFGTRIDNIGLTLWLILLSTFASIGLGILLSGISRDVNGAVLLSVLVTFPMLFLAGLFYPVEFMPAGAQVLAGMFPLTYTVAGLRGSMLRGFDFGEAATHSTALAAMALAATIVGILLGRRFEGKG